MRDMSVLAINRNSPAVAGAAKEELAALVMLRRLRAHGVKYFFCNPGTDFPAIVEAFSMAEADPEIAKSIPSPIVVTHENAAVAIAHGVFLVTGRPQAVMVHVNVGTANTVNGAANANRDNAPILLMAGRTPITEFGLHGSRSRNIHSPCTGARTGSARGTTRNISL